MVRENSTSNYRPCQIDILSVTLLISSLTSVCSVEVPHTTDSVDWALVSIQKRYKLWHLVGRHYTTALFQGQFSTTHARTNMAVLCPSGWSYDSQLDRHTWLHVAFASFPPPCLLLQGPTEARLFLLQAFMAIICSFSY